MADTAHDGRFTLVILDDENDFLAQVQQFIVSARPHWSVITSSDSNDCLQTCKNVLPDVVIIDERLLNDRLQGHEVLKQLSDEKRSSNASVPVLIMLTIHQRGDAQRHGWPLGQAYLNKADFAAQPESLIQAIEELYRRDVPGAEERLQA